MVKTIKINSKLKKLFAGFKVGYDVVGIAEDIICGDRICMMLGFVALSSDIYAMFVYI